MVNVFPTLTEAKGHEELGSDGFACHLDCGGSVMLYARVQRHPVVHMKYVPFCVTQ